MYEKLMVDLDACAIGERTGYHDVELCGLACAAIKSLTAQLATIQSENAEKDREIERLTFMLDSAKNVAIKRGRELARTETERDVAVRLLNDVWEMLDPDGPEGGYGEAAINMVAYLIYDKIMDYRHRFDVQGEE